MRIAVIGGGISGLSAAWLLKDHHDITLFEKESELGGHAHTEIINIKKKKIPIDMAFIVLNKRHYPNFVRFLEVLDVRIDAVKMILSVSLDNGKFEWSTDVPNGLFADRRNVLRPSFWKLLLEVLRFNRIATAAIPDLNDHDTLAAFLDSHHFSADFRTKYLYPLTGAIWSTSAAGVDASSAKSVIEFLHNHGVLKVGGKDRLDWYTIRGGSREYVQKAAKTILDAGNTIKTNVAVTRVVRGPKFVNVHIGSSVEKFDYVIMSAHADTALALLENPSADEKRLLAPFAYELNEVYLHDDLALMPKRRRAWGTWTYAGEPEAPDGTKKTSITYYMNALQRIETDHPVFVTLNPANVPNKTNIYQHRSYSHPVYSPQALQARTNLHDLQGKNRTLFCGSYFGHGFHEDGITSAINAVERLGVTPPWDI